LGEDVTLIARGAHLTAIRNDGLKLLMNDGEVEVAIGVKATDNMRELEAQDLVILGVKAHQIESVVDDVVGLLGPESVLLTTQNGIPWWYFQKHGGKHEGRPIEAVDPNGRIANTIDSNHIVGCIAYPAAEIAQPGTIRHVEGYRFPVGELDGTESERVQTISTLLSQAGFKSPILSDLRSELWLKLWGNLTFNPISALTHSTLVDICQFPPSRQLAAEMMTEAQRVAHKLGVDFRVSLDKRIEGAEKVGKHKTSMLQDLEAGKGMEIESLIGAVAELGQVTDTPTPHIDTVYALIKLLDKTVQEEGLYIKGKRLTTPLPVAGDRPKVHSTSANNSTATN
ncbi:MAG: 2-dehydropantoate 2-reductase, partial [Arenicellales bacterium]|nr:2-dehydropantoate 2-reductase [Arenicellales bacterium]